MSELQKMVSINGIWMVLLSCAGLSMTFQAMQIEQNHYEALTQTVQPVISTTAVPTTWPNNLGQPAIINWGWDGHTFRTNYLRSLLAVFILVFISATYWLLYLINPVRWVCMKTFVSIVVTCISGLVLVFGFVVLINPADFASSELQRDDLIKLFVTCILCFSSSLFFARMGFLIEQRRRKGEYSIAGGLYTGTEDSPIFVRAISHETTQNIPGISDEPPKYESLTLDVQLPTYTDLSV